MKGPIRHPLEGFPATSETTNREGLLRFDVTARALTPFGARMADALTWIFSAGLGIWLLLCVLADGTWDIADFALAGGIFFVARLTVQAIFRGVLQVTTVVVMTTGGIEVRHGLRRRRYDRNLEHRFALLFHDRTESEAQDNEFSVRRDAARGRVTRAAIYYGNSFHVAMAYQGHRVDLMEIFGKQIAEAVVARLQYCDARLEEAAKRGRGNSNPHAGKEWYDAPGGLKS